jgi:hypothetical protein
MIPDNLENAYAYEIERRKDEMRAAANNQLVREARKRHKSPVRPMAVLSLIARLLTILISR